MHFIDPNSEDAGAVPTLDEWRAAPDPKPQALCLPNDVDPRELADALSQVALVALQFPKWTDGRAYSQAHLLRARYRFGGEIRATGEVLVDMVPLLQRTGFDSAVLRPGQKLEAARRALGFIGGHYQGDVVEPRPRFARPEAR